MTRAQFIQTPIVLDRAVALTENRLTRKELEKRLTVEPSADADFITIRALDTTPENAAGLADAVNLAYRQILGEQRQAAAKATIAAFEEVQGRLASELAQIQQQRRAGDSPALRAEEQAKKRQMQATANKIEGASADTGRLLHRPCRTRPRCPMSRFSLNRCGTALSGPLSAWSLGLHSRGGWPRGARHGQLKSPSNLKPTLTRTSRRPSRSSRISLSTRAGTGNRLTRHQTSKAPHRIQESSEQIRLAEVDHNRVTASVRQALNSLIKDHNLLYSLAEWLESQHRDFPQITAERLRDRLPFDQVAVLLKTDEGLDLAGYVGWRPDGVGPVEHYDSTHPQQTGREWSAPDRACRPP